MRLELRDNDFPVIDGLEPEDSINHNIDVKYKFILVDNAGAPKLSSKGVPFGYRSTVKSAIKRYRELTDRYKPDGYTIECVREVSVIHKSPVFLSKDEGGNDCIWCES